MISKIEEISLNAWPALETCELDGWLLRFANGVTKRSNSVHLIKHGGMDITNKIRLAEEFYTDRNLRPCFKISEISEPDGIDSILDSLGYAREFQVSVRLKDLTNFSKTYEKEVLLSENFDEAWLVNYMRMNEVDESKRNPLSQILKKISLTKCFLTLISENNAAGCGLGVVENEFIGLYDIVIDKTFRKMGYGVSLIENLLAWGKNKGAGKAYLQVLSENVPAIGLYDKLGFSEIYKYWYRIKNL